MGLGGIKSFKPAETILFGYFLLPLRLSLKFRFFSHIWRPFTSPKALLPSVPLDSKLVDETLPFSYGLDDCPLKSIILYCIKQGSRMETSCDLTAVLSELFPGGILQIGRRPGLCICWVEQEIIKYFVTKRA